jgi:hypothetical protein
MRRLGRSRLKETSWHALDTAISRNRLRYDRTRRDGCVLPDLDAGQNDGTDANPAAPTEDWSMEIDAAKVTVVGSADANGNENVRFEDRATGEVRILLNAASLAHAHVLSNGGEGANDAASADPSPFSDRGVIADQATVPEDNILIHNCVGTNDALVADLAGAAGPKLSNANTPRGTGALSQDCTGENLHVPTQLGRICYPV